MKKKTYRTPKIKHCILLSEELMLTSASGETYSLEAKRQGNRIIDDSDNSSCGEAWNMQSIEQ